jgi:ribosomal protein S20
LLPTLTKRFAQAGAKGLIHHNTASRVISRLTKRLAKVNTSSPPAAPAPS